MKRRHKHGSVEEHPKGSGHWRVRARVSGRLVVVVSDLPSRTAAEEHANAYALERQALDLREGITLSQFGAGFLARRESVHAIRSIAEDRNRWSTYVDADPIGGIAVSELRRSDIVEWRDRLLTRKSRRGRAGLGAQTVKNALSLVRTALQEAADRDLLTSNPAADVKVPRGARRARKLGLDRILLPDEQRALVDAVPEQHRPAVLFALATGVRWSELSWLRWSDVEGDSVVIRRSRGGKTTKSGEPRRIALATPALLALETAAGAGAATSSPWVFPGPTKRGPRKQAPAHWRAWVRRSGVGKSLSFHDLRHTCATSLLAGWWGRKWSLEEVRGLLGHSSTQVTERYARIVSSLVAEAVAATSFAMFPGGNKIGASSGDQAESNAFLNRGSHVRFVPGAPSDSAALQAASSGSWEQDGNIPRALRRALTAGPAPHVIALAEAYQAAMRKDAAGARDALAKCAAELLGEARSAS